MTTFLAVMRDETYCEFNVEFEAEDRNAANFYLMEQYPESLCVQLETPDDRRARESDVYQRAMAMYDDPMLDDYDY